jgi:hypothetical protein
MYGSDLLRAGLYWHHLVDTNWNSEQYAGDSVRLLEVEVRRRRPHILPNLWQLHNPLITIEATECHLLYKLRQNRSNVSKGHLW